MLILKVTKKQDFTFSLKNAFLEKPQWGDKLPLSSRFRVKFRISHLFPARTSLTFRQLLSNYIHSNRVWDNTHKLCLVPSKHVW